MGYDEKTKQNKAKQTVPAYRDRPFSPISCTLTDRAL